MTAISSGKSLSKLQKQCHPLNLKPLFALGLKTIYPQKEEGEAEGEEESKKTMATTKIPRLAKLFFFVENRSFHLPRIYSVSLSTSTKNPPLFFRQTHFSSNQTLIETPTPTPTPTPLFRRFSSESNTNSTKSFNFSDSDDEDEEKKKTTTKEIDKSKLPPPYDPFSKKPVIEEPNDPKDLQEIFHKMRTEGLINNAIKMFDALSKDGLTHEAMELFGQIKDKGHMPDVVAHTAVIEAYANAGQSKEAVKVYTRMLASGVKPNAYTYTVLIKGLARDAKLGDAKKYVIEMMEKGIRPNAGTYTMLFESFVKEGKDEEGREFLEQMKRKGFVPDEKAVREHLSKRGQVFRSVMNLLFEK